MEEKKPLSKEDVAAKLKSLRGDKSVFAVAYATGIGVSALLNYEAGLRIPRDEAKAALASYYHTTIDGLFYSE